MRIKQATNIAIVSVMLLLVSCGQGRHTVDSASVQPVSLHEQNVLYVTEPRSNEIRKQTHHRMAHGRIVPRRDAWNALADGAAASENTITLFYTRRSTLKKNKASGENQSHPNYWNREHLWPRSYGLKGTPADLDLFNLVPVDRTVNSSRGNKVFGLATTPHSECRHCRVSTDAWEPPDEVKGDIARVLFYMDVRYEGEQGSEATQKSANLSLHEIPDAHKGAFGPLSVLLGWHCQDGVSDEEKIRQEIIFGYQGNRNLFVDEPALVEEVYGIECDTLVHASSESHD